MKLQELKNQTVSQLNIRTWITIEDNFEDVRRFVEVSDRELNEIKSQLFWGNTNGSVWLRNERTSQVKWEKR